MKILLCTGIYPPEVGGPANYAFELTSALERRGHSVRVATYEWERRLPPGLRHFVFLLKTLPKASWSERVLVLDPVSVGFAGFVAGKIFRRPVILRTGGDHMWESYVERTHKSITLPNFYNSMPADLSFREKIARWWIGIFLRSISAAIFSTEFQRDLYVKAYGQNVDQTHIIENMYARSDVSKDAPSEKVFLWAGRNIFLKNTTLLEDVFAEVEKEDPSVKLELCEHVPRAELMKKVRESYAVILPSLSEISPNFILESVMQRTPFICTKHTGVYHRLEEAGLFIDPLSREDVLEKVRELIDPEGYARAVDRVRSFQFTHSYDEIAEEFEKVMQS